MKTWPKHLAGWSLFIAYEALFVRLSTGQAFPLLQYACYYGLNIALFYTHAHLGLRGAGRKAAWLTVPAAFILEMAVYLFLKYTLDYFLAPAQGSFSAQLAYIRGFLVLNSFRGIYFTGFSTLYWAVRRMFAALVEKAAMEHKLAESRDAYLQQQLSPHLLFNTLTFIYNTYYTYSREAAQCVLLLADILRQSLDGPGEQGKALLTDEVLQVRNFIALNQLRFAGQLCLGFRAEGDFEGQQIIPLVLLTLTENVFKHGYLKDPRAEARLGISLEGSLLRFETWNLKRHQPENRRLRSTGIKNITRRLDYSYPGRYRLAIRDEPGAYSLTLTIDL